MAKIGDWTQTADFKAEKHVPVIEAPSSVAKGEKVSATVTVGKEIAHPNTTAHHIAWVELYFKPEGEKFAILVGKADFAAHGAGAQGADTSTVYAEPVAAFAFKTEKSGTLVAVSYCNIHGLWESSAELSVK